MAANARAELMAEASRWHEKLLTGEADEQARRSFDRWRGTSSAHAQAYAEVEKVWRVARRAADAPAFLALRHQTLARLVVSRPSARPRLAAAAALVVLCAATLVYFASDAARAWLGRSAQQYETGVGERLTVELADGSTVMLNTASRLRIDYSKHKRHLVLETGQAFFVVAKQQSRPFVVTAADRSVTARGTQFDVRLAPGRLQVGLLEGLVSVSSEQEPHANEILLHPNEVLVADAETTSVRSTIDVERLAGWREGFVFFENDTLADAAEEMNRYIVHPQIEVRTSAAELKLSGAFRTGQVGAFVEALVQGFPIAVVERTPERIVLESRGDTNL